MQAVSDAGPIIHLAEINRISLLNIFKTVHLPDAVWQETIGQGRVARDELETLENIQRKTVSPADVHEFTTIDVLEGLHAGELECLHLCHFLGIVVLLTDDLAVRDVAKDMGIQPVGSLGVVLRAFHIGMLKRNEAEKLLLDLYQVSSLYVTQAIVDLAIEQIRDNPAA